MLPYLKVKIKSLAAEARIIKDMERGYKRRSRRESKDYDWGVDDHYNQYGIPVIDTRISEASASRAKTVFHGLKQHRLDVVRAECRHSHLAYGFLRGKTYASMEWKCHEPPNFRRILDMLIKFGRMLPGATTEKLLKDWLAAPRKNSEAVPKKVVDTAEARV